MHVRSCEKRKEGEQELEITCRFSRKVFENENNGFCIAIYKAKKEKSSSTAPQFFTAKGICLPVADKPGVDITFNGEWIEDAKYGRQFSVSEYKETVSPTKEGTIAYLCSMVKGIGQKTAEKLYETFGDETLSIIQNEPERLQSVLRPELYERLIEVYKRTAYERELITFLAPYVPINTSRWLLKNLGPNALDKIKNSPFDLCNYHGIGFQKADEIARASGYDLCAQPRISEGILYAIGTVESKGHLFLARNRLAELSCQILQSSEKSERLTQEKVDDVIGVMLARGELYCQHTKQGDYIYKMQTYQAERRVAISVMRLLVRNQHPVVSNIDNYIKYAEKSFDILYSEKQIEAIKKTFQYNLHVITGYPGTGKTTVLKGIIAIQEAIKDKPNIILCSPTGRAARRMEETTGYAASTIHSLLGLKGDEMPDELPALPECDLIIIDEVSMLDIFLADLLLDAIQSGTRVVLVGDPNQLPSVRPGAVLMELIKSRCVPVTHLDAIFRQAAQSNIIVNSKAIRDGTRKIKAGGDFHFIEIKNETEAVNKMKSAYLRALMAGIPLDDIEILTPRRDKTPTSAEEMNKLLQEKVNPPEQDKPEIKIGGRIFRKGDKVMQILNANGVNNGDIGMITQIFGGSEPAVLINFSGDRQVKYTPEQMRVIRLAYAITVHKSQGSEFKVVIFCLMNNQYDGLLRRNLVYTAVTRAKEQLIIIGQCRAFARAIAHPDTERRNTLLAARLRAFTRQYRKQEAERKTA